MEDDDGSEARVEEKGKQLVVVLMGAPGSGKSTFCDAVVGASRRPWVRICQDTIGNGKNRDEGSVVKSAFSALEDGKSVFIDRQQVGKSNQIFYNKRKIFSNSFSVAAKPCGTKLTCIQALHEELMGIHGRSHGNRSGPEAGGIQ
ncbi:uncharacterized protein LOC120295831 [Eucalyptus grandis]|uniref:uncharacterized protein LOC120295831 n=1 Tax=Eucalyptus grandis TaxID=71139 RepID=UPI00192EA98D|nr:uncharacterized protein LOC120295831 [Eucalyptus grandis]